MIIICGTTRVKADGIEQYKKAAHKATVATLEEKGCITYGFYQSVDDPTLFRVYEEWESKEDLRAHGMAPHFATFRDQVESVVLERKIQLIEPARIKDI